MNKKRFFLASLVVFVIIAVLEYVFHNICLARLYADTANLWRPMPAMMKLVPYGYGINLIFALLFTYIYIKGYEAKGSGLGEGLRFGLIIGVFVSLPMAGWSYISMPIPFMLGIYWFIMGLVKYLVAGAAVGLIYKKPL